MPSHRNQNQEREPLLPRTNGDVQRAANSAQNAVQQHMPSRSQQLYLSRALGALSAGKLPTQAQTNRHIEAALESEILKDTGRLSQQGYNVLYDVRSVLESIRRLGNEKNSDDKIQKFIYSTTHAAVSVDADDLSLPVSEREARQDMQRALSSLRNIGTLVLSTPEFRALLFNSSLLVRDILADAAESVADVANQVAGAATDAAAKVRPDQQERERVPSSDKLTKDYDEARRQGKKIQRDYHTGRLEGQAMIAAADVRDAARAKGIDFRKYIDERTPDDARDAAIERLKKVIVQTQSNELYHSSIDTLVSLVKKYGSRVPEAASQATDSVKVDKNSDVDYALSNLREVIETFAGGRSLQPIFDAAQKVFDDVHGDPDLQDYFDELDKFVDRLLHDEGYVTTPRASRRFDELYNKGKELRESKQQWKKDGEKLYSELQKFVDAIKNDKTTNQLLANLDRLGQDLAEYGRMGWGALRHESQGLYRDFFDVWLPRAVSLIKEAPMPRIEYKSAAFDLALDDLVISSASFIPDLVHFTNHNDFSLTQGYAAFATEFDSSIRLHVKGLRFKAERIAFYLNKKTGWIPYEDSGLLSVDFTNKGISFDVRLENAAEDDRECFFVVKEVHVDISDLNYSISESSHSLFNFFYKPFIRSVLQTHLTELLEAHIARTLQTADLRLFGFQQRVMATTSATPDLVGYMRGLFFPTIFSSASSGLRSGVRPTKRGVVKTGRSGEYILAIGVDEQILPGKGGPRGYQERKAAIAKAQKVKDQGSAQLNGIRGQVEGSAQELQGEALRQKRKEERETGWQSEAFNL